MANTTRLYFLVGPSGVGKDTLLKHLKMHQYSSKQPIVAHRYITRPVGEGNENHIELAEFDYYRRKDSDLFLFDWESNGYLYAVGREVRKWVKLGNDVIVNGSRRYLQTAREIYPSLIPIWMTVSEDVLTQRLLERGESEERIEERILQNRELEQLKQNDCVFINNDQTIEDTLSQISALIEMSNI